MRQQKSRWITRLAAVVAVVTGAGLLPAGALAGAAGQVTAVAPRRPNIVFVLADDLDATTTPYWDAMPKTKALLADTGLTFTSAFGPTPICCPARSTILTGKYGHNTGVLTNGGSQGGWATFYANGNEDHTVAKQLQQSGYTTALIGKYLNGIEAAPTHVPTGWNEWYGGVDNNLYSGYDYTLNENGTLVHYGTAPSDYSTDVLGAKAVDFVDRHGEDTNPFFLYLAPTAPHLPLTAPPRYAQNPWTNASVPKSPNYNEADLSDKPTWLRNSGDVRSSYMPWTEADYRNRMGSLMALDDAVANVVEALRRTGSIDNTLIVFTSDNGYNNGSHRLIHKMAPYEESLRVPLVVSGPGVPHGTDSHMILETDFTPTFLAAAGVPVPADVDGRSFAPMLLGRSPVSWRHDFLAQYASGGAANGIGAELPPAWYYVFMVRLTGQDIPSYRALRTDNYLFVEWYGDGVHATAHAYELYDLRTDPYELNNLLAGDPSTWGSNAVLAAVFAARTHTLLTCSGTTCRN